MADYGRSQLVRVGFPKRRSRDVFHAFMINQCKLDEFYDVPIIGECHAVPQSLVSFSEAVRLHSPRYPGTWVHFYENDSYIERFWNSPKKYLKILRHYAGVIAPDYSLCTDFPYPLKQWNNFRNYASGAWLQSKGLLVIANIRLCGPSSAGYALAGAPHACVMAIGTHGNLRNSHNRQRFVEEVELAVDRLSPTTIVAYGSDAYGVFDYPRSLGVPVVVFPSQIAKAHKKG